MAGEPRPAARRPRSQAPRPPARRAVGPGRPGRAWRGGPCSSSPTWQAASSRSSGTRTSAEGCRGSRCGMAFPTWPGRSTRASASRPGDASKRSPESGQALGSITCAGPASQDRLYMRLLADITALPCRPSLPCRMLPRWEPPSWPGSGAARGTGPTPPGSPAPRPRRPASCPTAWHAQRTTRSTRTIAPAPSTRGDPALPEPDGCRCRPRDDKALRAAIRT